jgi:hypothetical protein
MARNQDRMRGADDERSDGSAVVILAKANRSRA